MNATATKDRRQCIRKIVRSGIVALQEPNKPIEIANVIDICPDGLSFIVSDESNIDTNKQINMDILLINENIFLESVSSAVISDIVIEHSPVENKNLQLKRLGVQFDSLDQSQVRQLKKLGA